MLISANESAKELLSHDNIMLITHMNPDGDTLGSAFALYNALVSLGKTVKVCCGDKLPQKFSYMYTNYIEKDFVPQYIVAVDVASPQLLGELECYSDSVDLCIDHHPSNDLYSKKTFLNHKAAATCELIYEVVILLGAVITKQISNCIYTGIVTDSGCFKYSNTTGNTHIVAAKLFEYGAEYETINRSLFDTKSKSRIAIEQQILNTIEYFYDGTVALIDISRKMVEDTHADESELDGVSSLPRTIEGVEIGITIREREDGFHKISLRTTSRVDASEVCKLFGGGGHKRAAGCLIKEDYETTKKLLIDAIKNYI